MSCVDECKNFTWKKASIILNEVSVNTPSSKPAGTNLVLAWFGCSKLGKTELVWAQISFKVSCQFWAQFKFKVGCPIWAQISFKVGCPFWGQISFKSGCLMWAEAGFGQGKLV